ncbi:hypothetical protein BBO_06726 [Beauveria brongniartii RCEF 3172]|uniref:Uncharacterized protein n=1 Tax=Beauveria brongniartii RCEF 3172 TaxID=1081107 RepID=A0A167AT93_9HYPO|nr:hypothetical protein BBO_06726 [Beauveria brongniartii RCEF 3172]
MAGSTPAASRRRAAPSAELIQIGVLSPSPRHFADRGSFGRLPYQSGGEGGDAEDEDEGYRLYAKLCLEK